MADRTVTITSTKLIIAANGLQIRFYGLDIIEAKPIQKTTPNVNTGSGDWYVDLKLTGEAREVYGDVYPLRLLDVSNKPAWRNDLSGAQAAAAEIAPMIRSTPSGGGGGQVDTIVPGAAIDVDSTDPVNPIVSVADTAVSPGSYTFASITVDQKGRLTAASSGVPPPGTVTNFSFTDNATFDGTVTNATTTPNLSLTLLLVDGGSY